MARDAYSKDQNDVGHRFSVAGSLRHMAEMSLDRFDALQAEYRAWLIGGFEVPNV